MAKETSKKAGQEKLTVLFLCTGNSCRSQMAEGWARALKSNLIEPYSAGIEPKGLDPLAVRSMAEAGLDISGHWSKHVDDLVSGQFDYIITVCDHAHEHCPVFPGRSAVIHKGFDDPPRLAASSADETAALDFYIRVRDEIKAFIDTIPEALTR